MKNYLLLFAFLTAALSVTSQESHDSTHIAKTYRWHDFLREFRVQLYVQPQFQKTDTSGAKSYAGGDFPSTSDNRFTIRRGRLKLSYEHENAKGFKIAELAFQIDVTEKGFTPKDFYARVIDPWTGWIGLQGGMFSRPFGFEVPYSDGLSESPERGRMSQIIFPGERDLGAALVIESPKTFKPVYLRLDASVVNGTGNTVSDIDRRKDFIGHLQAAKTFGAETGTNFTLSGGVSYYNGGVLQSTPFVYDLEKTSNVLKYTKITDSSSVNKKFYKREYYGVDLQAKLDYKLGQTILRGEFIAGTEPGTSTASSTPTALGSDLYIRKFNGAYFYFIQTFKQRVKGSTIYHDLVFKYDVYDPNSQIRGKDLSIVNDPHLSGADVKYQTFGVGYLFRPYEFFKLTVWYDFVKNENTNIPGYKTDLKDNVLTIRGQFYFDSWWFNKKQ
jgi:hypothetical protein